MNKKPNRLIHTTSPYLLQHAYNPVDWYFWGSEAFEKATKENKMIFLSIGYSTCHWCHVMERESFENEEIAEILNAYFVPIKVDREELPDVDHIYMKAIQLMGIQGGWPLNVFLTPDLKPITGGTYFPPEPKWGMPSFKEVLQKMIYYWEKKKNDILQISEEITKNLQENEIPKTEITIKENHFLAIIDYFYQYFDKDRGGFLINGRNKFPPSINFFLLIQIYKKTENPKILNIIETTLRNMRHGGIYDQIGGGISRYSTDHNWLVPHFEKMLYDNALFAWINIETYRITKNPFYLNTTIDILEYLFRDMHHPDGGFYSAEDADSEGEEGKFYLWTKDEFIKALKNHMQDDEIELLIKHWGITEKGNFESKNILYVKQEIPEELLKKARAILLEHRSKRVRPGRDEKILTSWNAMMISLLSHAYLTCKNDFYLKEAIQTFNFILNHLTTTKELTTITENGIFYRSYSNYQKDKAPYLGTLTDHASMGCALIDLYKATGNIEYINFANSIKDYILNYFYVNGKLYETKENENYLIVRSSDFYDGVIPSGLSFTFRLLVHLYKYGVAQNQCEDMIKKIMEVYYPIAINNPFSYSYFLMSVFKLYYLNQEIVILAKNENMLKNLIFLLSDYITSESIIAYKTQNLKDRELSLMDIFAYKTLPEDCDYNIYLCENFSCKAPVSDINFLTKSKIY